MAFVREKEEDVFRFTTAFGESARLLRQRWFEQEELPNDQARIGFVLRDQVRRH